ncbi:MULTISPECIES: arsenate reductase family protein [Clostridium]|uniref:ArsC family transcriptional regulator n=1 Tax=Clostridium cibarium TaxID=2762247 RepID=A0ABR8PT24_9CLOT|nr:MULTISPECIES: arsenate reductase family protein [Clostridium]MBD7911327.1 ArsC family transcriptional regulator [Clostridium cibarium]
MNIQIFGTKKCFDTKKAERFFKERRIKYQLIDMKEKGMSKGELNSVKIAVGINELINVKSKNYLKSNISNVRSSDVKEEILFKDQSLIATPVVRNGRMATLGFKPEVWDEWIASSNK